MGILSDRWGGRWVFVGLMVAVSGVLFLLPFATSFSALLVLAFFLGIAGSSFAVGIAYLLPWAPPERQGSVLGIYGLGNAGHSAAVFLGPLVAVYTGREAVFYASAVILAVWTVIFAVSSTDAARKGLPKTLTEMVAVFRTSSLAWALAFFYFLTFGGFVAFAVYLPTLLVDEFQLSVADAGFRTAGFVILATLARPVGGWLSDQIGGARTLTGVFGAIIPFALLLSWPAMLPFTVGALGCAALLGVGNGAVFKLVAEYFREEAGTVTGLVGAMGGMGGFFPPLVLGFFRDQLGFVWPGFVLLAATSAVAWWLNQRLFVPRQVLHEFELPADLKRTADRLRASSIATVVTGILVAAIVVGSRNLQNFDPALVIYTFSVIFATWGVTYHYAVWTQKPPTALYWKKGRKLFLRRGIFLGLGKLLPLVGSQLLAQTFIRKRAPLRWWMHQFIFWGCLLAVAITFPLVFGWIHFGSAPEDQMIYVTYLFGFPVASIQVRTFFSWFIFHGLDIAAVLVLAGVGLSLWRRLRDRGALSLQSFSMDFIPLLLLAAISVTGLALTASVYWFRGVFYDFLAIIHAITVIGTLLYLPFGKFFHIFQRPAQLGVKLYYEVGDQDEGSWCKRCGERFASKTQIEDLRDIVLPQLNFDYRMEGPAENWQNLCPACKRKAMAAAQLRLKERIYG